MPTTGLPGLMPLPPVLQGRRIDRRILFAGGDEFWFQQLEHDLLCLEPNWLCEHMEEAGRAKTKLASCDFDVLVVDSQLSGVRELLGEAESKSPQMARMVICEFLQPGSLARWSGPGLTPMPQDIDAGALATTLTRAKAAQCPKCLYLRVRIEFCSVN